MGPRKRKSGYYWESVPQGHVGDLVSAHDSPILPSMWIYSAATSTKWWCSRGLKPWKLWTKTNLSLQAIVTVMENCLKQTYNLKGFGVSTQNFYMSIVEQSKYEILLRQKS